MFHSLPLFVLIIIFLAGAAAVWFAGIQLSNTTDTLSTRLKLGQALGGLLFLAIATNLPEIAISATAGITHSLDIAIGNILGGIGIQTVVLVALDVFGVGKKAPLSYLANSLDLVLECVLVVAVLIIAIMGTQLPASLIFARLAPGDVLILITWVMGVWLIGKARKGLPWQEKKESSSSSQESDKDETKTDKLSTRRVVLVFGIASLITLVAGVVLEESGNEIASHIGLNGVIFGATVLAVTTSLPELSTGLASVKNGDYALACSDIFGGNAFLPVLFLLVTLLSGTSALPQANHSDVYLASLGVLLTCVYMYGLIFRTRRQILRMGIDSFVVLILYIVGTIGLVAVAGK